ncbi:MAG: Bax inhibitor-1/YccA family protein [Saprospiraceae bacterium]|jgi:FtsH-binding integral membrane protein|uniref:Bax inhibitor-1/YccA family protein n=1 Tax=Candidatus Brachybacter algidus TaxID=2982024 RepID=UPI001B5281C7|nr:Bax inhibitor-1/YccA family protein [Candidatus Brachybacter algidus]MBP7306894.1 Bax inhibitor-1/YccA family protein [Saprospiraceae bacterium]MBK6373512.1 Bax inhibitor-1/YccA family protein [Candidatus Brachybacter algidus]MBK6449454.1 Bax inhibitor-1/YccA family protein [Candidatus Brachybacter algidus]MBK7604656.1 Bax inhibitor-1/YccA family protein [Candidatus Brachybacter algidus]MBK8355167.1 Bax inhibitor-1/YccA family protein [Candidatus Brachybacter algidus]
MEINQRSTNFDQYSEALPFYGEEEKKAYVARYISKVYGWMFLALSVTAVVAGYVSQSEAILSMLLSSRFLFFGLLIGQLFLVGFLTMRLQKMNVNMATTIFFLYAALNGLTFAVLLLMYTPASLMGVFGITAGTFGIMSAVGYYTKQDLTGFGQIMLFGLIGVIVASVVNFFMQSEMLYWIISYVGVAVFVGLIAYDTQKIKGYALLETEEQRKKGAILGALALYLDFINLFIYLLRLFGSRK